MIFLTSKLSTFLEQNHHPCLCRARTVLGQSDLLPQNFSLSATLLPRSHIQHLLPLQPSTFISNSQNFSDFLHQPFCRRRLSHSWLRLAERIWMWRRREGFHVKKFSTPFREGFVSIQFSCMDTIYCGKFPWNLFSVCFPDVSNSSGLQTAHLWFRRWWTMDVRFYSGNKSFVVLMINVESDVNVLATPLKHWETTCVSSGTWCVCWRQTCGTESFTPSSTSGWLDTAYNICLYMPNKPSKILPAPVI